MDYLKCHKNFKKKLEKELDKMIAGEKKSLDVKNIPSDKFCVSYPVNYKSFDEMGHFYVPKDVTGSELLRSNLHNLLRNVDRYIDVKILHDNLLIQIANVNFEAEKEIYSKQLESCIAELKSITNEMNMNLSPYHWEIDFIDNSGNIFAREWRACLKKQRRSISNE